MKLLLDECTPKRLRLDFPGHTVHTVEEAGLKGLKNGALLQIASSKFDVLITVDKNIHSNSTYPTSRLQLSYLWLDQTGILN